MLVHAAWTDASSWNKVVPLLEKLGLRVRSAQIPLTSLSDDVAALKRLLKQVEGPVLLAGHSYDGAENSTIEKPDQINDCFGNWRG